MKQEQIYNILNGIPIFCNEIDVDAIENGDVQLSLFYNGNKQHTIIGVVFMPRKTAKELKAMLKQLKI